ncbi:hypothetical protein ACQEVI_17830 [Promicromonospora sp. CA-289599]|uniref:hypothetical protein n=1 Tax=Promicromonospora sp. CA-289599 TaxID=3240014 RepID=UPI003D8CDAC0
MLRRSVARATVGVLVAAVVGIGVAGCSGEDVASLATSSPSASVSSSPSPSMVSPEDKAIKKAEAAVRDYYRVVDAALSDPKNFNPEDLKEVAIMSGLYDVQNARNSYLVEGRHDTGETSVEVVEVRKLDLTHKPKAKPQPVVPTVQLMVCLDSTDVDTVDKNGKSLSSPDRQFRNLVRVGLRNDAYPEGPWRVSYYEFQGGEPC